MPVLPELRCWLPPHLRTRGCPWTRWYPRLWRRSTGRWATPPVASWLPPTSMWVRGNGHPCGGPARLRALAFLPPPPALTRRGPLLPFQGAGLWAASWGGGGRGKNADGEGEQEGYSTSLASFVGLRVSHTCSVCLMYVLCYRKEAKMGGGWPLTRHEDSMTRSS